ncbi:MAG TPA: FtsX-like permease family protein [Thermoleophilaceae bacterium]
MTKAAVKGLLGRKVRTSLTAFAVVLGVAMVSGTYVLTDTISKAFDSIFNDSYKGTSAVISGKEVVTGSTSGTAPVPASLLPKVKNVNGVDAAAGAIFDVRGNTDFAKLIDSNGKVISSPGGAPNFGWGIDTSQPRFNPFTLEKGKWAAGPRDVVIDSNTASKKHFNVGDTIGVSAQGPTRQFHISGVAKLGSVSSIGGATFALFTVPTAQQVLGKQGQYDEIFIAAKPGVSEQAVANEVKPLLPASATVKTARDQAKDVSSDAQSGVDFIRYLMLAFAAIALVVGSFVIFNTISMTLTQRVRELATLRTLGASRKQVRRSVLLEGLIIGVVASVIGLALGIALAKGLNALFVALGIDMPQQGTVVRGRTILVSLLVGVAVTVLATWGPARRATRVPPISAVREGATLPRTRLARNSTRTAAIVLGLAAGLLIYGLFAEGLATGTVLLTVGLGCILLFVGVGLISSRLVGPLAAVVGAPAERFGGAPGRLARENSVRNPTRTARTAGALMIGLALVALIATLGAGVKNTDKNAVRKQVTADYVVTSSNGFESFIAGAGDAAAKAPGVEVASSVRADKARALGSDIDVTGVDPATIGQVYAYGWTKGSDATLGTLGTNGAVVKKDFANDNHLAVGSNFTLTTPAGKNVPVQVKGIYEPPNKDFDPLLGSVSIPQRTFDSTFPRPKNLFTFLNMSGGESSQAAAGIERALAPFPDAKVRTESSFVDSRTADFDKILSIFYVLLALSVIISLFGVVNALVLAVYERTRELGMLRAVGMTQRQTRRMVRDESVIMALIGAALGLPLGIFLAAIITRALRSQSFAFSVPVLILVIMAVFAFVAGVVASMLPARRASRLNVLNALQYE